MATDTTQVRNNIVFNKADFQPDPAQQQAIQQLERLYLSLTQPLPRPTLWDKLRKRQDPGIKGLYLWGGVGRGKTLLMDQFFEALPFVEKRRVHFHRFMQEIHQALNTLPRHNDPLSIIAKDMARDIRLLCLDEFHVSDIGDAMLLAGFLSALFEHKVCLVTTSNIPPDELYRNGLQRQRFLPAIELIKTHTDVFHLDSPTDYRLKLLERTGTYHIIDENTQTTLEQQFRSLAPDTIQRHQHIHINHRDILATAISDDLIWFEFAQLCETHRSAADYIVIASTYHTVMISNIPVLAEAQDDVAQRFIHLIDALYDHNVKIIVSAHCQAMGLYTGRRHQQAFQRTASRLQEMASEEYLGRPHRY